MRRQGAIPALRLALRVGLLAAPGEPSECCAFYTALLAALRRRPQVVEGCLEGVDVVFPPVDVGVVHYPSFLGELAATGEAKEAFFLRRLASAARLGEWLAETRLEPGQVALIVDAESSMTPCSRLLAALTHRFEAAVHATICATEGAYRPGRDVSLRSSRAGRAPLLGLVDAPPRRPAVLPAALGDAAARPAPASARPILASFRGRRTHGLRSVVLAMGRPVVAVDALAPPAGARGYADLMRSSAFALCPRGDAPYSFRFAEALSFGAVPARAPRRSDPRLRFGRYGDEHRRFRPRIDRRGRERAPTRRVETATSAAATSADDFRPRNRSTRADVRARAQVVYGDDWVLPFSELLDYRDFAVVIREEDVLHTANILRAVPPGRRDALQAAGRAAFLRYFATVDARLDGLFAVLARRRRARDETHTVARTIAASWAAPCDDDELALLRRAQGQG